MERTEEEVWKKLGWRKCIRQGDLDGCIYHIANYHDNVTMIRQCIEFSVEYDQDVISSYLLDKYRVNPESYHIFDLYVILGQIGKNKLDEVYKHMVTYNIFPGSDTFNKILLKSLASGRYELSIDLIGKVKEILHRMHRVNIRQYRIHMNEISYACGQGSNVEIVEHVLKNLPGDFNWSECLRAAIKTCDPEFFHLCVNHRAVVTRKCTALALENTQYPEIYQRCCEIREYDAQTKRRQKEKKLLNSLC